MSEVERLLRLLAEIRRTDTCNLGGRAESERPFDEDVAIADQQHTGWPVPVQHGPRRVVQPEAVRLVQVRLERVGGGRQIVPQNKWAATNFGHQTHRHARFHGEPSTSMIALMTPVSGLV